jgi:hypothetical protein
MRLSQASSPGLFSMKIDPRCGKQLNIAFKVGALN